MRRRIKTTPHVEHGCGAKMPMSFEHVYKWVRTSNHIEVLTHNDAHGAVILAGIIHCVIVRPAGAVCTVLSPCFDLVLPAMAGSRGC